MLKKEGCFEAILVRAGDHPRAIRTMEYADRCEEIWGSRLPERYPSFEEWRGPQCLTRAFNSRMPSFVIDMASPQGRRLSRTELCYLTCEGVEPHALTPSSRLPPRRPPHCPDGRPRGRRPLLRLPGHPVLVEGGLWQLPTDQTSLIRGSLDNFCPYPDRTPQPE